MSEGVATPGAEEQLAAIASLSRALDQERIDYWLFGGWAVDFWVGRVTREHDDIDVAAWRTDYDAIGTALQAAGWRHAPVPDEVVGTRYQWGMAQVEFTFMTTDTDGQVVIPLPDHPVVWSAEHFGDERRQLSGVDSRIIPLAFLKAGKSSAREGSAEAAKDRSDAQALSGLKTMTTSTTSSVSAKGDPHVTPCAKRIGVRGGTPATGGPRGHS